MPDNIHVVQNNDLVEFTGNEGEVVQSNALVEFTGTRLNASQSGVLVEYTQDLFHTVQGSLLVEVAGGNLLEACQTGLLVEYYLPFPLPPSPQPLQVQGSLQAAGVVQVPELGLSYQVELLISVSGVATALN